MTDQCAVSESVNFDGCVVVEKDWLWYLVANHGEGVAFYCANDVAFSCDDVL